MTLARVLVIAGSDSGGGAGIQADIKAIGACGAYAATAITAVTAQDTTGVHAIHPVPIPIVVRQIECVLDDIGADAIKIGMLGDGGTVDAVADCLAARARGIPVVLDPVAVAKGGAPLLAPDAVARLRDRLFPLATVVTPNLPEATLLLGHPIGGGDAPAIAAVELLRFGAGAVLLKGGHADGPDSTDLLATPIGVSALSHARLATPHTHGTGCTLASALAAGLAQGMALGDAVRRARAYVRAAIAAAPGFGRGHGPLNHLVPVGAPTGAG